MTYSIVGYDPNTDDLGVAVQSKFMCVGAIVPWARANVGAVATQSWINTTYGPNGLSLLESGMVPAQVIQKLTMNDEQKDDRQVGVINNKGEAAAFTGQACFEWAGHIIGENYSCQGNILISEETVQSMASAFENQPGDLADKLIAAVVAADQEGRGDVRGKQSASLLIVREKGGYGGFNDRFIDIRVDEHPEPIKELERVFKIYDMTFLPREPPENLLTIEGDIAINIKEILQELGYLDSKNKTPGTDWEKPEREAFEWWVGINNFENKWRDDGKVWNSIYDYMLTEKGTSYISLKKMSER